MSRVFLDANIILDLIDKNRGSVEQTKAAVAEHIKSDDGLFTSCDIFTTVYYVANKKIAKDALVEELEKILCFVDVLPIDMGIIKQAIELAKTTKENDLEDLLQYVCALQNNCELIVTNDKLFYQGDIKLVGTNSKF